MTPQQPQPQSLEEHLKTCSDREYAEYIVTTMTRGNSPLDFDREQSSAIMAIRSRKTPTPAAPCTTPELCSLLREAKQEAAAIRNQMLDEIENRCKSIQDKSDKTSYGKGENNILGWMLNEVIPSIREQRDRPFAIPQHNRGDQQ